METKNNIEDIVTASVGATDIYLEETVPVSSKESIDSLGGVVECQCDEATIADRLVEVAMEASEEDSVLTGPDGVDIEDQDTTLVEEDHSSTGVLTGPDGVDNLGEDSADDEDNEYTQPFPHGEICQNPSIGPSLSREVRFGPIALTVPTKAGLVSAYEKVSTKVQNLRTKTKAGISKLRSKTNTLRSNIGAWLGKLGTKVEGRTKLADEGTYTPYFATIDDGLTASMLLELTNTLIALSPNAQYFTLRVTELGGRLRVVAKCASFATPMAFYPSCAFDAFCRIIEAFEGGEYVVRCLEDWLNIEFIAKTVRVENHIVYVDGRKVGTYLECFGLLHERGSWSKGLLGWLG